MSLWFKQPTLAWGLRGALTLAALSVVPAFAQQQAAQPSYFEFGTVVALEKRTVDIQTFNPQLQRVVQHSFVLTREARVDLVHVGDSVEVVYSPTSPEWTLRRLVVLAEGIPMAGPPRDTSTPRPAASTSTLADLPAPPPPVASTATLGSPTRPTAAAPAPKAAKPSKASSKAGSKPAPTPATSTVAGSRIAPGAAVAVGNAVPVTAYTPQPPRSKDFAVAAPSDGCRRADPDWPTEPMRIAVIDFRYPTEREESHDLSQVGGGSGTAIADLVFNRLSDTAPDTIQYSRGDRRRLDKTDFAGAARLGRQLGVDAVLAGTFFGVDTQVIQYGEPVTVKTYELRAGLVDTCTGQLLYRLSSVTCANALEPGMEAVAQGTGAEPPTCKRFAVSAGQAANPKSEAAAFQPLLDAMLYPLEHGGKPPRTDPSPGTVSQISGKQITVHLAGRTAVHAGDQLSIHTWRLAKNPVTYTLQNIQSNEIGRMTVTSVNGSNATGTYEGDIPPLPGDTAEAPTP